MARRKKRACGEKMWTALLHSPYEDGWKGAMVEVGVGRAMEGKETKRNRALGCLCPCERECVCKSVCKCVCRCADLALLSESCIRVAYRKGHRTTVVLQKKKKKEPQSHQNQNFLIEMERARGKGEGGNGMGRGVYGNRRQEHGRMGEDGR